MITNSNIGKLYTGQNLGNQLFQIAGMYGLAKRYGTQLLISPGWKYIDFFELGSEIIIDNKEPDLFIKEAYWHYCIDFFDVYEKDFKTNIVNIDGFLQTEKYWEPFKNEVRKLFKFSKNLYTTVYQQINAIVNSESVVVSVRRGDFITNPNHYLLPAEYYLQALDKYFPNRDIVIFSDDFRWCKKVFKKLLNRKIYYSEKLNAVEQLCFMSMFSNFVISNSTFSWWGAYLADASNKIVIRPHYVFDGDLKQINDIKDHYPDEWIEYKHDPIVRSNFVQYLFYNDNNYRIKKWGKNKLSLLYNKLFKNNK